jgi:acyl-coenzyme A synthetase/AMP-(fatty) acid ligase
MMKWIIEHIAKIKINQYLVFNEKEFSCQELYNQINEYIVKIRPLIQPGKTVAILSDYSFEAISIFFALYENNNIIVPITTNIESEIQEKIDTALCHFTISVTNGHLKIYSNDVGNNSHQLIETLASKGLSGLILFSSGSSGIPKAMIHNLDALIDSFKNRRVKTLNFLIFLMFDHIGGLNTIFSCLAMGAPMVFPMNRNPIEICQLISKNKINILPASPTFLNLILLSGAHLNFDLSSLRMITYGTEPMPSSLLQRLKDTFPSVKFSQTFGTSETGISQMVSKSSTSNFMRFEDSSTEQKVINGELYIRSKTQVLGYLNSNMDRFTVDGWFRTGDLVEETSDGYFRIIGRNTEVINVGGEKVLPSEVESVLYQFNKVHDCIVFGESNPITGQIVVAKILYSDNLPLTQIKNEIRGFCKNKLEKFKIPAKIILMSEAEYTSRFKKKRIIYDKF